MIDIDEIEARLAADDMAMHVPHIAALIAEVRRCHARLEIDHEWRPARDGETPERDGLVREPIPYERRASEPDGIECRDATIAMLQERLAWSQAENERDAAIAQSLAAQSQAARSVLDATARAEAAERDLAAERAAHELEKREHDRTWQQRAKQIERAEAAEKRAEAAEKRAAEAERERDEAWTHRRIAQEETARWSQRVDAIAQALGVAEVGRYESYYDFAARCRIAVDALRSSADHWRAVAESRPDISREDAARYLAWRSGFAPHPRNFDRLQPIDDALRAHAKKAVPR